MVFQSRYPRRSPHRSTGASRHAVHKIHPTAGGGEEFVRIPARAALFSAFSFPPPTGRLPCTQVHLPTLPLPTTHVFAFQRDVSLNARIAPGLTTLPEGEPVSFGADSVVPRQRHVACFTRRRRRRKKERHKRAAPKLAKNRLRLSFHAINAISPRLLSPETSYVYIIKTAFIETHT